MLIAQLDAWIRDREATGEHAGLSQQIQHEALKQRGDLFDVWYVAFMTELSLKRVPD